MRIKAGDAGVHDLKDFVAKFYVKKGLGAYSALLVDCKTGHYKTRLKGAERLYFVIEGKGAFTVNGRKETADLHDLIVIKNGDVYEYVGRMKLVEVNIPATDESNEETL